MRIRFVLLLLIAAVLLSGCSIIGGILSGTGSLFNKAGQSIKSL